MKGMVRREYQVGESKGILYCETEDLASKIIDRLAVTREILMKFIDVHPDFKLTLEPWVPPSSLDMPPIIKRMIDASTAFNVGPMASVAGALVDDVLDNFISEGKNNFIMENGGEVRVHSINEITIGLHAGDSGLGAHLGFIIPPNRQEFSGIGTSSATIGNALSFGTADAVTVFCTNAALADAAATAICNATGDHEENNAISAGLEKAKSFTLITGAVIARGDHVGTVGVLPKMVRIIPEEAHEALFM